MSIGGPTFSGRATIKVIAEDIQTTPQQDIQAIKKATELTKNPNAQVTLKTGPETDMFILKSDNDKVKIVVDPSHKDIGGIEISKKTEEEGLPVKAKLSIPVKLTNMEELTQAAKDLFNAVQEKLKSTTNN